MLLEEQVKFLVLADFGLKLHLAPYELKLCTLLHTF
jgi:hypothetical protein